MAAVTTYFENLMTSVSFKFAWDNFPHALNICGNISHVNLELKNYPGWASDKGVTEKVFVLFSITWMQFTQSQAILKYEKSH
jgi:hypothetical protein